jgi:hypothetical protein
MRSWDRSLDRGKQGHEGGRVKAFSSSAGLRRCLVVCLAVVAFSGGSASTALGAPTHAFDPELSLTGDCSESGLDPIPDPGCPGGSHPPSGRFILPMSVATDSYGNVYVASYGQEDEEGKDGRIDIFDSSGTFITEIADPDGPRQIAVDTKGNLYVFNYQAGEKTLKRYSPTTYEPVAGNIDYPDSPVLIAEPLAFLVGLAVDYSNDHLFVHFGGGVTEFDTAANENKVLKEGIGDSDISGSAGPALAVDSKRRRLYAGSGAPGFPQTIEVFGLDAPHPHLETIEGTDTPAGKFALVRSLAVDEGTGNLFVYDSDTKEVLELNEQGKYLESVKRGFKPPVGADIGIDNGANSPNGALDPFGRYLFVPSHPEAGYVFAFGPVEECEPVVESVSAGNVSDTEAELRATIEPCHLDTTYLVEYTTQQSYEEEEFAGALVAGAGKIPAGGLPVDVFATANSLSPGTAYRFRVTATNKLGPDEGEGVFTTRLSPEVFPPCPNDATRSGPSLLLPDCRAYELVTPPDTNAHTPRGIGKPAGVFFTSRHASPAGDAVSFITEGGALPGTEATGSLAGDAYLATRGAGGWSSASAGPSGAESSSPLTGSVSPDQGYSFWRAQGEGTAVIEGNKVDYVRHPDGHSEAVGQGSLGTDLGAAGKLIAENGSHILFVGDQKLEEEAPLTGTQAIYDRTADGVTHVVSLLPGDTTPEAGQNALYQGASLDGKGVAFSIGSQLYFRHDNQETYEVGENVTFAGVAEGGERIFYLEGGDLSALDVDQSEPIRFTEAGNVTPVNVSSDGTAAYFVSSTVLTGEENPNGQLPVADQQNLYLSEEGVLSFVGILTKRDVEGEIGDTERFEGLGLWMKAVGAGNLAIDPSRTAPDGDVLLFEARANLTGVDAGGHAQVYRYDSVADELACLSCNPTGTPVSGEASLQSIQQVLGGPEPFLSYVLVDNLRADGRRAFFQSEEALAIGDTDGLQDVYEWDDQGVGSCKRPGGCVYLISSGHSSRTDYLYGVSASGDDVFFRTSDLLLPADSDATPSIYDARVEGGFPETDNGDCQGEACRPVLSAPPPLSTSSTSPSSLGGETPKPFTCPKGKRKVKKGGKVRCVKKKHGKHRRHRAGSKQKGAGK